MLFRSNKLDSRGGLHAAPAIDIETGAGPAVEAAPAVPQQAPLDRDWVRGELFAILALLKQE